MIWTSFRTAVVTLFLTSLTFIVITNVSTVHYVATQGQYESPQAAVIASNQSARALEKANKMISSLKDELEELRMHCKPCSTQSSQQESPSPLEKEKAEPAVDESPSKTNTKEGTRESSRNVTPNLPKNISTMCSILPQPIPSTLAVWRANLDKIVNASQHANDRKYAVHDYTAELLHLVSQQGRIQRSIVGMPKDYTNVKRVMELVHQRYHFLQHGGDSAPKVKILVMGGSLIVGVNCRKIVSEHKLGFLMPHRLCTWAHRLEFLLNNLLDADIFEVHKIAMGGTNTATGFVLWDSDFLPTEHKNPDILINAYSTNDMHILTVMEAEASNTTLRDKVMEMIQDFVRSVMKEAECAPLILHMDDYLGNEQREVLTTMHLSQAVQTLSSYYGFAAMSYANVVRDLVYGDTKEAWFSPGGWYEGDTMVREIHPGMGMHIVSSWVAAYTLLNLGLTYCTIEEWDMEPATAMDNIPYQVIQGLPPLKNTPIIPGKPKPIPGGLLPALTPELNLENITALWRSAPVPSGDCLSIENHLSKCPFSWISGISVSGKNATYAKELFETFCVKGTSWTVDTGGDKLGMSPSRLSKEMLLEFPKLVQPIHSITIFYMKSYGEQWDNSEIALSASTLERGTNWTEVRKASLFGFHNKKTSETYTYRMEVDVEAGMDFRVGIQLVGGTTFKVMGLAICK